MVGTLACLGSWISCRPQIFSLIETVAVIRDFPAVAVSCWIYCFYLIFFKSMEGENEGILPPCQCEARRRFPEKYQGIPEGYCGLCDICGQPGHWRQHPHLKGAGGAWCDRHWEKLIAPKSFGRREAILYHLMALLPLFLAIILLWLFFW